MACWVEHLWMDEIFLWLFPCPFPLLPSYIPPSPVFCYLPNPLPAALLILIPLCIASYPELEFLKSLWGLGTEEE
jgi:hypothetical protein